MPNWLGDAVMATPVLADLRNQWPNATLTAMCQGGVASLLKGNPHLNEIFSFSRPNEFLRRQQRRDLIARLRQGKYDLGILLPNSFSSAWWFWRGGVKTRVGFASDFRSFLLTHAVPFPPQRGKEHLVLTYKRVLEPLGIPLSNTQPRLYVTDNEREAAVQILRQRHIPAGASVVGINPGAAYGSAKCWLPERFREVISRLAARPNTYVVCFADPTGAGLVHSICQGMPPNVINLAAATTLRELIALIEQCTVFLTNDSGPMHIAAALRTPLVALFGSTNDIATGPYGHGEVIHKHVECSPCYRRTCPIDFRCMTRITSDEVYTALVRYLP
ncbi:lipopolysaccharide heptosyltransferase II [Chlamydiota bacterium]